jgi:hypothetical protein
VGRCFILIGLAKILFPCNVFALKYYLCKLIINIFFEFKRLTIFRLYVYFFRYDTIEISCSYHPDAPLIEDYRAGDQICSECGLVVGDR